MTPASLIYQAKSEGIQFTLSTEGKLKLRGESAVIDRLLPAIREHKAAIMKLLRKPAPLIVTGYRCSCGSIFYRARAFSWTDLRGKKHQGFSCLQCETRYWFI